MSMRYIEPVFRPPSEARSYILQVTYGCSHNKCSFCAMYLSKHFKVRPFEEVLEDIQAASQKWPETRRVFLADGDAMILKTSKLLTILDALQKHFPKLARVGIYTDARCLKNKTDADLIELKNNKLGIVYLGLESGSNKVLEQVNKGASAEEMTDAMIRVRAAGIKTSVIGLLGMGGKELSEEHAQETAKVINNMSPNYFSALTLTIVPETEIMNQIQRKEFTPLSPEESLAELYRMVKPIDPPKPVIFRTNHASNYLPLEGNLPQDKDKILEAIQYALKNKILKPEWMRGL